MNMINNLFSMFDPGTSTFSLNWLIFLIPLVVITPQSLNNNNFLFSSNKLVTTLSNEISSIISNNNSGSIPLVISIFISIAILNSSSLLPFNFTISSQISVSLPLALSIWFSYLIIGWIKNTNSILAHLLPTGTPNALIPIIVLIETTSQLIRPITLSVRLTANMVAGHLLITLLGSILENSLSSFSFLFPAAIILTILEMCVSIIQAFVFITLLTLYSTEID